MAADDTVARESRRSGAGPRRAAEIALGVLGLLEAIMVVALLDDLGGHSPVPPLICALLVAGSVSVLLAARRRAADDPGGARARLVLGIGLAFTAASATALLLAVYSIS